MPHLSTTSNKSGYVLVSTILAASVMLVCLTAALTLSLGLRNTVHRYFERIYNYHYEMALLARAEQQALMQEVIISETHYDAGEVRFEVIRQSNPDIVIDGQGRIFAVLRSPSNATVFSGNFTNTGNWFIPSIERFGFGNYSLQVSAQNKNKPFVVTLRLR